MLSLQARGVLPTGGNTSFGFPNGLGFFFRLFLVMFLDVILVTANWAGDFGGRDRRLGSNAACSGRDHETH